MGLDAGYGIGSVKPGVCTSTTRPGSPFTGQIIYETDTTLAKVWTGSAWVDTPPGKANTASPTFTGTVTLPADTSIGTVSATEIGYVDGVTSAIQTQLNTKSPIASPIFTGLTRSEGGSIGSTVGSKVNCFEAYATSSNGEALVTKLQKIVAAGDWTNNAWMIQKRVDVTEMGFIKFGTYDVRFGVSATDTMIIDASGTLTITGATAFKASGTTWSNPSDQRIKNNIRDYNKGTAELMQVRVREWEYNGKGGTTEGTKGLGVVADEVVLVLPNTVDTYEAKLESDDEENTDIKRFDATEITWLLVKTVQEQQATIQSLTERIEALEA
jgi:hypothetical protein